MKNLVLNTSHNWSATVLRLVLGLVIFSHGAQSMLGWFGGSGFTATMEALTSHMSLPWIVAFMVICIQFFGSLMLITGFATRIAALGMFGIFVGMASYHFQYGFHMNWFGTKAGEGFEFHTLVLAMNSALLILGGGAFSVDRKLISRA